MNTIDYIVSFRETLNHPFNRNHKMKTIFRIIFWKVNQWFFHLPAIVEIDKNIKCICYPDSSYGGMIIYSRWAEYDIMQGIISNLSSKSIYFDIGANIGDTTVIATGYTKGKIYAFEPSPVAFPRLVENISLNHLDEQITAERVVLSDKEGVVQFSESPTSETSHIHHSQETSDVVMKVGSTTLDNYVKKHKITRVDLMKIDVEGAEMLVLRGAANLLKHKKIKHLIIELNFASKAYGYTNTQLVKYLKSYNYKISKLPKNLDEAIVNIHAYV